MGLVTSEDKVFIASSTVGILQALKPLPFVNPAFYGVIAIAIGLTLGSLFGYTRSGATGVVDGAVGGLLAAIEGSGAYGIFKSMGEYVPAEKVVRDAKGRFAKKEPS
jgi:hypothetical protein